MTPLDKASRAVYRLTIGELGYTHGKDKRRRLVCGLEYGDLLVLRPHGTRRTETVALIDVYSFALRSKANKLHMEKLRNKKAEKQAARERRASLRKMRCPINE